MKIRTFICLELPNNLISRLSELQKKLALLGESVGWVKPTNIHLTLRFLGDVEAERQSELKQTVESAVVGCGRFNITALSSGAFPNLRNPRVFWVSLQDSEGKLLQMQKSIETELQRSGFGKEDKPFSPHLTIGRVREGNAKKTAELLGQLGFEKEDFEVREVIIMRSDLSRDGAKYSKLQTVILA